MVFHNLARDEQYDLWIGDEAWELDYYLHENPQLKSAAYGWLTDFVGWLPMPDGAARAAAMARRTPLTLPRTHAEPPSAASPARRGTPSCGAPLRASP